MSIEIDMINDQYICPWCKDRKQILGMGTCQHHPDKLWRHIHKLQVQLRDQNDNDEIAEKVRELYHLIKSGE
jgi:hypothetical protein